MTPASGYALSWIGLLDRLVSALVQLERSDDPRIGPQHRIELAWSGEQLRSFGASCHGSALEPADGLPDRLGVAASTSRELVATLDRLDDRDLEQQSASLREVVGEVAAVISWIEAGD